MLPPFQALMDEHADDVWRFCVATAGRQEAEDCFQETFLAALRAYPELRSAENLRAWLLKIAHSKVMDAHRGRVRRPRPVGTVPDGEHGPRAQAPAYECDDELWSIVQTLPDRQRAAVAYRFVCDLSYADVARALSCSPDAARRSVHEGIKKLREAIGR